MVAPETFGVSVYSKTALKGPAKVGSAGERGFTCAHVRASGDRGKPTLYLLTY